MVERKLKPELKIVVLEVTRRCNLSCVHCRATSQNKSYSNELTTQECFKLFDEVVSFSRPLIILTGGEPLIRKDIFEIARHGTKIGLPIVMAVNGTLIDNDVAFRLSQTGIHCISISLDGATVESHDTFRGVPGAFRSTLSGIEAVKRVGLKFQINTTLTKRNRFELPAILELAENLGAVALDIFFLVGCGRGKELVKDQFAPEEYEQTLNWIYEQKEKTSLQLRITCAPHHSRVFYQRTKSLDCPITKMPRGCMAGVNFCFISHTGELQPCGYLELDCGNVRKNSFKKLWENSEVFNELRDLSKYKGKCGICEFLSVCGGCRARAYLETGDFLQEEPYCVYQRCRLRKVEVANVG